MPEPLPKPRGSTWTWAEFGALSAEQQLELQPHLTQKDLIALGFTTTKARQEKCIKTNKNTVRTYQSCNSSDDLGLIGTNIKPSTRSSSTNSFSPTDQSLTKKEVHKKINYRCRNCGSHTLISQLYNRHNIICGKCHCKGTLESRTKHVGEKQTLRNALNKDNSHWQDEGSAARYINTYRPSTAAGNSDSFRDEDFNKRAATPTALSQHPDQDVEDPTVIADKYSVWRIVAVVGLCAFLLRILLFAMGSNQGSYRNQQAMPLNPGDRYVAPYLRNDGTTVRGHWRTNPDGDPRNNYSGPNGSYFRTLNGRP